MFEKSLLDALLPFYNHILFFTLYKLFIHLLKTTRHYSHNLEFVIAVIIPHTLQTNSKICFIFLSHIIWKRHLLDM